MRILDHAFIFYDINDELRFFSLLRWQKAALLMKGTMCFFDLGHQ